MTNQTDDASREAFEETATNLPGVWKLHNMKRDEYGKYLSNEVQVLWLVWQACDSRYRASNGERATVHPLSRKEAVEKVAEAIQDSTDEFNGGYDNPVISRELAKYISYKALTALNIKFKGE